MTFTVLIPVYNGERFISRTIESVIGQVYEDWELIIINDGSTDGTYAIAEKYLKADSRIKLINCSENSGRPAVARNLGLRQAKAKYIAFLDSDDLYYPGKLSEVIKVFEQDANVGVVCHGERRIIEGRSEKVDFYGPYESYEDLLFRGNSLSTSAVVFRKDYLQKAGYFSEKREFRGVEDYDFWMRLSKYCKIFYLQKALGEYHIHNGSVSSDISGHCANTLSLLEEHFSNLGKTGLRYSYLIRQRRSLCLRSAAKEFVKVNDFWNARIYLKKAIIAYPLTWKNWALMAIALARQSIYSRGIRAC